MAVAAAVATGLALDPSPGSAGDPGPQVMPSSGCARTAPVRGNFAVSFTTGGVRRSAVVHLPHSARGHAAPLVLAFHGSGGNGPFMQRYSGISGVADRSGFVAVYPSANGPRWSLEADDDTGRSNDVHFTRELLDRVEALICVDRRREFATGVSNGGGFTVRLGCELSDRIAAIAPVAGGYYDLPPCDPDRPVSVLEIHGTADRVVPYAGHDDGRGAARGLAQEWAGRDGCPTDPLRRRIAPRTVRFTWQPCSQGAAVEHIALVGGQHAWPGATPPDPGPASAIQAAPTVWSFFSTHRLAAKTG